MKNIELINDLLINNEGLITTEEVLRSGISKPSFYAIIKELDLKKAAHGVYVRDEAEIDHKYILQLKYPKAVISHESAAFIHGLLSQRPAQLSVTLNTGINPARLTGSGIKVYTVKEALLDLGKSEIQDEYGRSVSIYNIERTVCDIIRSRNKLNADIMSGVLKAYVRRSDRDLVKLMLYAKSFRLRNIIREYLEILL
ncbi:MAG: abortive phage infection protein [Lachnospiraceae bacterium]|nr:abortive phage infection protein [Lachnospiraceae bacterium]